MISCGSELFFFRECRSRASDDIIIEVVWARKWRLCRPRENEFTYLTFVAFGNRGSWSANTKRIIGTCSAETPIVEHDHLYRFSHDERELFLFALYLYLSFSLFFPLSRSSLFSLANINDYMCTTHPVCTLQLINFRLNFMLRYNTHDDLNIHNAGNNIDAAFRARQKQGYPF